MSTTLEIRNGPSKADLLRSVTNVAKGLTTTFETDRGPIEAQIESLDESPNGVDFMLKHDPKKFVEFIEGIKAGLTWQESMQQSYNLTPQEFVTAYGRAIGVPNLRI